MYENPRIISQAITNNRLNWDERSNRTIVVPSLIEGILDDVVIGEETVIEGEVNGKIMSGKGLKHFVFLKDAEIPTWIMDNHNHAFAFWHEAYWKGWIKKGSLLIHIDQHTDLATPLALPMKNEKGKMKNDGISFVIPGTQESSVAGYLHDPESRGITTRSDSLTKENDNDLDSKSSLEGREMTDYPFDTLEEVEDYTNSVLTIADFIVPALATGLVSEAVMVTGEDMQTSRSYVWQMKNDEGKMTNEGSLVKKSAQLGTINDKPETPKSLILDIDLDYFSQGFDDVKTLETTKYWIEKADIITIATSPLFIDQEKALEYLRKLF